MSDEMKVRAGFDRLHVDARRGSRHYLVAEAEASEVARESKGEREPLHLALVIDRSGSMAGGRLEAAKEAARGVIERLGPKDRLSVIAFDNEVEVHVDGLAMDAAGAATAQRRVSHLRSRNATDLFGGWLAGAECVARDGGAGGVQRRVIVLSDGKANQGVINPVEIGRHAAELYRRGIVSSAVGIGDDYEPRQLLAIAEHGGGNLHDAMHPTEIVDMVAGELGESLESFAERVWLDIALPEGARIECWSGYDLERTGSLATCSLGSLPGGRRRPAIFAVDLPGGPIGEEMIVSVGARWRRPGSTTTETGEDHVLRLTWAQPHDLMRQWRDIERSLQVADAWQARLVRAATSLNLDGDYVGAQRIVTDELEAFDTFVRDLPGGDELSRTINQFAHRSARALGDRLSKEVYCQSFMSQKGSLDYRRGGRSHWKDQLDR